VNRASGHIARTSAASAPSPTNVAGTPAAFTASENKRIPFSDSKRPTKTKPVFPATSAGSPRSQSTGFRSTVVRAFVGSQGRITFKLKSDTAM
jgi:hypothetical protein